jgi:hypothetical protein
MNTTNKASASSGAISAIVDLAHVIEDDKEVNDLISSNFEKKLDTKLGPVHLWVMLTGKYNPDQLAAFPRLSPRPKKGETPPASNNPEWIKVRVKRADGMGDAWRSQYETFASRFAMYKAAAARCEQYELAIAGDSKADKALLKMGPGDLKSDLKTERQRRDAVREQFRTAFGINHAFNGVKDLAGVSIKLRTRGSGDAEEIARTVQPFVIWDNNDPSKSRGLSIQNLLKLDWEKAALAGGGYDELVDTLSHETPELDPDEGKWDFDAFNAGAGFMAGFFEDVDDDENRLRSLYAKLRKPEYAELLVSLFDIRDHANAICAKDDLQALRNKYVKDGLPGQQKAAA